MAEPTPQPERRLRRRQPLLQTVWICQPFRRPAGLIRTEHQRPKKVQFNTARPPCRHRPASCPCCPPDFLPDLPRRLRVLRRAGGLRGPSLTGGLLLLLLSRPTCRSNSSNRRRSFALSACNAAFSASSRATAPVWRCSLGGISGPVRPAPSPLRSRQNASSRRFPTHTNAPAQSTIYNFSVTVCSQSRCRGRLSNNASVPAMAAGAKHPGTLRAHGALDAPTPCPRNAHPPQHPNTGVAPGQ